MLHASAARFNVPGNLNFFKNFRFSVVLNLAAHAWIIKYR